MTAKKTNTKDLEKNIKTLEFMYILTWASFLLPIVNLFFWHVELTIMQMVIIANVATITIWLTGLPASVFADTRWKRIAIIIANICNIIAACLFLFIPNFWWFIVAAFFQWLYLSFWSWTWHVFLEENLKRLWSISSFGKKIWHLFSLQMIGKIITPFLASLLLKYLWWDWYTLLALIDVIIAWVLLTISFKLKDIDIAKHFVDFKTLLRENIDTIKLAAKNIYSNKKLLLITVYRSLASHVSFFLIIALPLLVSKWMEDWQWWLIQAIWWIWLLFACKYAYKIWEAYWYSVARILATISQWIILVLAWLFMDSWLVLALFFIVFMMLDGLRVPTRNHLLIWEIKWIAAVTTKSIIISIFALYMSIWKQLLSFLDLKYALIGCGLFMIWVNIILAKDVYGIEHKK